MANQSDEGESEGLGWIDADVKRFDVTRFAQETHLPHMGWNDVIRQVKNFLKSLTMTDHQLSSQKQVFQYLLCWFPFPPAATLIACWCLEVF